MAQTSRVGMDGTERHLPSRAPRCDARGRACFNCKGHSSKQCTECVRIRKVHACAAHTLRLSKHRPRQGLFVGKLVTASPNSHPRWPAAAHSLANSRSPGAVRPAMRSEVVRLWPLAASAPLGDSCFDRPLRSRLPAFTGGDSCGAICAQPSCAIWLQIHLSRPAASLAPLPGPRARRCRARASGYPPGESPSFVGRPL